MDQHTEDAPVTDHASWSAHVGDVVQQIQEFAGQLQHKRRLQEVTHTPPAGSAGSDQISQSQTLQAWSIGSAQPASSIVHASQTPVQHRQLLQQSSARAAGFSTQQQPPAFTKTAPETPREADARLAGERAAAKAAEMRDSIRQKGAERYPTLYVVNSHISDADFPRFYKTGDAFVLPTRGEGWGRPHVESMSMG
jgi:glycosyltransferase involved in cell wall biosynthesis